MAGRLPHHLRAHRQRSTGTLGKETPLHGSASRRAAGQSLCTPQSHASTHWGTTTTLRPARTDAPWPLPGTVRRTGRGPRRRRGGVGAGIARGAGEFFDAGARPPRTGTAANRRASVHGTGVLPRETEGRASTRAAGARKRRSPAPAVAIRQPAASVRPEHGVAACHVIGSNGAREM